MTQRITITISDKNHKSLICAVSKKMKDTGKTYNLSRAINDTLTKEFNN